jgi:hypothetical protein
MLSIKVKRLMDDATEAWNRNKTFSIHMKGNKGWIHETSAQSWEI